MEKENIARKRRNSLTKEEVEVLCMFCIKYHISEINENDEIKLCDFVDIVNRYSCDTIKLTTVRDVLDGANIKHDSKVILAGSSTP